MALVKRVDFASALNIPDGTIRSKISRRQLCCNKKGLLDTENTKNFAYLLEVNGGNQSVFDEFDTASNSKTKLSKKSIAPTKNETKVSIKEKIVKSVDKNDEKSKKTDFKEVNDSEGSVNIAPSQNKIKKCLECGDDYSLSVSNRSLKYCSDKCKNKVRYKVNQKNKEKRKERINSGDIDFIANEVFLKYKQKSPSRGLEFKLDLEFFKNNVFADCYYCGNELSKVGFDRKDNSVGYIEENCVPCCPDCNFMKRDMSFEDFVERCKSISFNFSTDEDVKQKKEPKLTAEERKIQAEYKKQNLELLNLDRRKREAEVKLVERNAELKQWELEKKAGNTLPLDMIEKVVGINYKAVFKSIHSQAKNIAMVMVQQLGGSKDALNSIMIELENILDKTVKDAEKKSAVDIEKLIDEYSEVRSRGERKV